MKSKLKVIPWMDYATNVMTPCIDSLIIFINQGIIDAVFPEELVYKNHSVKVDLRKEPIPIHVFSYAQPGKPY